MEGAAGRGEGGVIALAHAREWQAYATREQVVVRGASGSRTVAFQGVRDLAFDRAGRLLVATDAGLFQLDPADPTAPRDVSPAPGAAAREVLRVVRAERWIALATRAGAFVAHAGSDPLRFVEVDGAFPREPVRDLAIHGDALHAIVGRSLWRAELSAGGQPFAVRERALPSRLDPDRPVALLVGSGEAAVVVAHADALYVASALDPYTETLHWTTLRPVLPPGAEIQRLAEGGGRYWLATDRGLLEAPALAGPWQRSAAPAGRAFVSESLEIAGRIHVASSVGLLVGKAVPARAALAPAVEEPARPAPAIHAVHRAVLREQGLEARVVREAWRGVRRRAWLPVVSLSLDADRGVSRARERDEAFISGAYHTLRDRDRDRSFDYGGGVSFTWDFRDTAFEREQIDLSREARLVIALRDDVLDEVNQLYFERLSIANQLARPAQAPADPATSRGALRLRLLQLTAALDAWTGGWFSEQLEREVPALE